MGLTPTAWSLEFSTGIPAYKQIINLVQAAVSSGVLNEGNRLPTIRSLHQQLQVNPNTVVRAYRELELMGVIQVEHGSGCYVAPHPAAAQLSEEERQTRIRTLVDRFKAEAQNQGIAFPDILQFMNDPKNL